MNPTPDAALLSFCLALTRRHLGFNHTVTAATLYSALIAMPYRGAAPWDEEGKLGIAAEAALIDALTEAVRLVKEITPKGEKPDADAVAVIVGAKLRPVAPADAPVTITSMGDTNPFANGGRLNFPVSMRLRAGALFADVQGSMTGQVMVDVDDDDIGDAAPESPVDRAEEPGRRAVLRRETPGVPGRFVTTFGGKGDPEPPASFIVLDDTVDIGDAANGGDGAWGAGPEAGEWAGYQVGAQARCHERGRARRAEGKPRPTFDEDPRLLAETQRGWDAEDAHLADWHRAGCEDRRDGKSRGDTAGLSPGDADAWREGWDAENTRILAAAEDARRALAEDAGPAVTFDVTLAEGEDLDALASLVGVERDAVLPFGDRPAPPAHDNLVATMGLTSATPGEWFGQIKMEVSDEPAPEVPPRDRTLHHLSVNRDGSLGLAASYPKGVIVRPTVTHLTLDDGSDVAVSADLAEPLGDKLAREAAADPSFVDRAAEVLDEMGIARVPLYTMTQDVVVVHRPGLDDTPIAPATCAKPYGDGKVCGRDPGHAGAHGKGRKGGES